MGLFLLFLIANLPDFHPQAPIECKQYYPGTDYVLPKGVSFNYTSEQKVLNNLRCYCEEVKRVERECRSRGFARSRCLQKTATWASNNLLDRSSFENVSLPRVPRRKNVIVNIQPSP